MTSSCKGFDVFEFKGDDEISEKNANRYSSKFQNPDSIDNFKFLETVAQGTNVLSNEIGNVQCADVDGVNSDHNCDSALSYTLLDAGEAPKRMYGFDVGSHTDVGSPKQLIEESCSSPKISPESRTDKLEPENLCFRLGGSSILGASSSGNSQLNCNLLESPSSHDSFRVVSDADGSQNERSPSTSSDNAEDDDSLDGASSDHGSGHWEMGDRDAVAFNPDYVMYHDMYHTNCVLTFSSSWIEIEGSVGYGNQETFSFHSAIDNISYIESELSGKQSCTSSESHSSIHAPIANQGATYAPITAHNYEIRK
ncbi:unnamed protein product [Ilex paraguariensis]|uniref:Probable ubiquitin-like-specific protease 2A/B PH domain-containing protein n=1 Tax=Ilex paraguariensis TaxID=185542 RepID=A0ABC8UZV3_9AQUA